VSTAFAAIADGLVAVFERAVAPLSAARVAANSSSINVLDGPAVNYVGTAGVAVGATREDVAVDWSTRPGDLAGDSRQTLPITCLAWSGSGSTSFAPHRTTVAAILTAIEAELAADRDLGGVVSTAWITGGTWMQEQTGSGALVTCEFRVTTTQF
jgi:hypothetical protein